MTTENNPSLPQNPVCPNTDEWMVTGIDRGVHIDCYRIHDYLTQRFGEGQFRVLFEDEWWWVEASEQLKPVSRAMHSSYIKARYQVQLTSISERHGGYLWEGRLARDIDILEAFQTPVGSRAYGRRIRRAEHSICKEAAWNLRRREPNLLYRLLRCCLCAVHFHLQFANTAAKTTDFITTLRHGHMWVHYRR